jgi:adenosylcobinamide-GDP ribazoletransferase
MTAFLAAFSFLTIIPASRGELSQKTMSASRAFFPVVGLFLGAVLVSLDRGLGRVLPLSLTSAILVVTLVVMTRGLHLEGFLDTCDGLLGGYTKERRLEIMRDPHVGAFAVAGGFCLILLKWTALCSLPSDERSQGLLLFPILSRWAMVLALAAFPYARAQGLGSSFHQGSSGVVTITAAIITLSVSAIIAGVDGLILFMVATTLSWLIGKGISTLLGGLTGDAYGAINELTEVALLVMVVGLAHAGRKGIYLCWAHP